MNALLALHVHTRRLLVIAPEVSSSGAAAGGGWPLAAWEKGWQLGMPCFLRGTDGRSHQAFQNNALIPHFNVW